MGCHSITYMMSMCNFRGASIPATLSSGCTFSIIRAFNMIIATHRIYSYGLIRIYRGNIFHRGAHIWCDDFLGHRFGWNISTTKCSYGRRYCCNLQSALHSALCFNFPLLKGQAYRAGRGVSCQLMTFGISRLTPCAYTTDGIDGAQRLK